MREPGTIVVPPRLRDALPSGDGIARLFDRSLATLTAFVREHWMLLLILPVALAVRWTPWGNLHYYGDDAEYAIVAGYLAQNPLYLAYPQMEGFAPEPFVSQPPLMLYLFALGAKITGSMETGAVLISLLLGTATVALLYFLGVALTQKIVGAAAAAFLALAPLHVDLSRRAFLDVGYTFFFVLALLLFVLWTQRQTAGLALATGFAAAATALGKLPGVLIFPVLAIPFVFLVFQRLNGLWRKEPDANRRLLRLVGHGTLAGLPALVFGGLYLGLLYYLEGLSNLAHKLGWQADRLGPQSTATAPWHTYLSSPQWGLANQFGLLFFLLAIAGAIQLYRLTERWDDARAGALAVLSWPVIVGLFFTLGSRRVWFYILPVVPALALLGAFGVVRIARWIADWAEPPMKPSTQRLVRGTAFLVAAGFLLVPVGPLVEAAPSERPFGYGVKEAALWIDEQDPEAAQIGTLLGRFTIHFYNGHPTYHWFTNHTFVEQGIQAGAIRYIVSDDYLGRNHENQWMDALAEKYNATVPAGATWTSETGRVVVYELHPN